MKKLFTDKESAAISFLAVTFLLGMGVDYYRDKTFEEGLAGSIPKLIAEDKKFKEAALMLQSDYDIASSITKLNDDGTLRSIMLNKAPIDGLTLLPGIGQIIAERIISRRNSIDSFKSVDELLKVKGIGKIKLNKIRPYIIIGDMNENTKN
ncbi:helix-hairpin-helix domain-containing protein [Candidatus Marinimicrobia bacterium MT.SAG.3]|nr:helix-hairpin-helix domain-containing protein [Candidatus Marinimicrobia bacterium MT.SAG.3]